MHLHDQALDLVLQLAQAGWLDDITNWLKDQFIALFQALVKFLKQWLLLMLAMWLQFFLAVFQSITPPQFLTQYSIGGLLGQGGGTILWLAGTFQLASGMAIIAAGWGFRLVRKLLTLGQW